VQSFVVVEGDPLEDLVLDVLAGGEAASVDELVLGDRCSPPRP
jgi:hypothetical protein